MDAKKSREEKTYRVGREAVSHVTVSEESKSS